MRLTHNQKEIWDIIRHNNNCIIMPYINPRNKCMYRLLSEEHKPLRNIRTHTFDKLKSYHRIIATPDNSRIYTYSPAWHGNHKLNPNNQE